MYEDVCVRNSPNPITLDGVLTTDQAAYTYALNHADVKLGPGATNLQLPAGGDSTMVGKAAEGRAAECGGKFAAFPR